MQRHKIINLSSISQGKIRFNLETRSGRIAAQVAASGIFLTEDGRVRSLQEVALATEERPLTNQELAAEARFEESRKAVWAMRAIIDMQRFRLRLMLARRNVQQAGQQRMDRFDSLLDRMHERRELFLSGLTPKAMPEGESAETTRPLIS